MAIRGIRGLCRIGVLGRAIGILYFFHIGEYVYNQCIHEIIKENLQIYVKIRQSINKYPTDREKN